MPINEYCFRIENIETLETLETAIRTAADNGQYDPGHLFSTNSR
jgi:hypothetical protein